MSECDVTRRLATHRPARVGILFGLGAGLDEEAAQIREVEGLDQSCQIQLGRLRSGSITMLDQAFAQAFQRSGVEAE
jgi:hypothetical protein